MPFCSINRFRVAGIGMAHNPHPGVGGEHAFEAAGGFAGAICHDDLARVLAEADPDPTPMVE